MFVSWVETNLLVLEYIVKLVNYVELVVIIISFFHFFSVIPRL
jgi:hypothetical protein